MCAAIVGLGGAMVTLGPGPASRCAAAIEEPDPAQSPALTVEAAAAGEPEDYVRLEVRETDLLLTNISNRPINAWSVKQVVSNGAGNEGYTAFGVDAYRSPLVPDSETTLLHPGESITLEKAGEPWFRKDQRDQGWRIHYEVGALTFEGGEAVGDPEIVERIFERRLDLAKSALEALEVTASARPGDKGVLDELPAPYRQNLDFFDNLEDAVRTIQSKAWDDYRQAVANLRPRDVAGLPLPAEVLP